MAPTLSRNKKNPFAHDQAVKATKTFAWSGGVVHAGDLYRGGDPTVEANWSAFVDAETLPSEMPNMWDSVPVPDHRDATIQIGNQPTGPRVAGTAGESSCELLFRRRLGAGKHRRKEWQAFGLWLGNQHRPAGRGQQPGSPGKHGRLRLPGA
jgi:hypothetical protein